MGLYECASGRSVWRGYYYFKDKGKHVLTCERVSEDVYRGKVQGTAKKPYDVLIDIRHPRKSTCSCPFAKGRRVVCKHMIALYFTVYPSEADRLSEQEEYEREIELQKEKEAERIKKYVNSLSKEQLRAELLYALYELEDYQNDDW